MNPSACSLQTPIQVDTKLSKLVTLIEKKIPYYKLKYGEFEKPLRLYGDQNHYVKIVEYFLTLNTGNYEVWNPSVILHSNTSLIEKHDPELADRLFDELVRVFEIPSLELIEEVFN